MLENNKIILLIIVVLALGLILGSLSGQAVRRRPGSLSGVCEDKDKDNYYLNCGAPRDCNDDNRNVYPGAIEICDNFIDDNCDGKTDESASCKLKELLS